MIDQLNITEKAMVRQQQHGILLFFFYADALLYICFGGYAVAITGCIMLLLLYINYVPFNHAARSVTGRLRNFAYYLVRSSCARSAVYALVLVTEGGLNGRDGTQGPKKKPLVGVEVRDPLS